MTTPWQQSQEGAAKEMATQNAIYCMEMEKKIIMYSGVKHTNTGSNQNHEPVNHMPKTGWASSILPTKLGSAIP